MTYNIQQQVADTERTFARTMATRDHAAFMTFLSDEAVFLSGNIALRGKQQIAEGWKQLYEQPEPPFSWEPGRVEVLDTGTLAISTGPVYDPNHKLISTFTSVWRLEAPDAWRVIFDIGNPVCDDKA